MICQECKTLELKSNVYELFNYTTLVGYIPFCDEVGKYHHHDRNKTTTNYKCSNDHKWTITGVNKCWCGWPDK